MINSYISIDLETTGLNPKTDKIIEIGAIKVRDGQIQDTFSALINPGRKLETRITELTGITDDMLLGASTVEEELPSLLSFLEELPLLGHRVLFDYSFLKKAAVNCRFPFEKAGIDTLKIARRYLTDAEHKNLEYLCRYYGIEHRAHRALGDAIATHELFQRLLRDFGQEDAIFLPQKLNYQVKREAPITKPQRERLYRLLEQHKIDIGVCVDSLTRSEADRIIDRIRAGAYRPAGS